MIDFELTERQRALQKMAHDFAEKEIRPVAVEYERRDDPKDCIPWEVIKKGNQLGFHTLCIPEEYGGFGASDLEYAIWMEEIAWGDAGHYLTWGGHNLLVNSLKRNGTEEQKRKWYGVITADKTMTFLCCSSGSEHGVVGDLAPRTYRQRPVQGVTLRDFVTQQTVAYGQRREMTKTARRDGDNYILNGVARFNTNGGLAKLYSVSAKLDPSKPDMGNAASFIVPVDTPGLSIGTIENKVGCRCSQQSETICENVVVPAEDMIGARPGMGETGAETGTAGENAAGLGVARAAYESALEYAQVRYKNGNRIIFHQAVALMLVDMFIKIQTGRLLLWKAAWHNDQTNYSVASPLPTLMKALATEIAMDVTTKAVQIYGGYGLMRDFPVEKYFRDAKVLQIQHGANDTIYAQNVLPWIVHGTGY